jgi:hypothetical protein
MNNLLANDGPIAKFSAFSQVFFGAGSFLTWGLGLGVMQDLFPKIITMFGLIPATDDLTSFSHDFVSVACGGWALGVAFSAVGAFHGTETQSQRESRQMTGLGTWMGFLLCHGKFAILDGELGGIKTPFNMFWVVTASVMVYAHLQWVSKSDMFVKTKKA